MNTAKKLLFENDLNNVDKFGKTVLMYAIMYNDALIPYILELGPRINAVDKKNKTALIYAAQYSPGYLDMLLLFKPNTNVTDCYGYTALMNAIKFNIESVYNSQLIYKTENLNCKGIDKETALSLAIKNPNGYYCVLQLLQQGVNPNTQVFGKKTPLMLAIMFNDKCVMPLLEYGASTSLVDSSKKTFLMYAIQYNQKFIPEALKREPDLNAVDINGVSIYMYALRFCTNEKYLKKFKKINKTKKDNFDRDEVMYALRYK